jgi:hypothetical protein
MAKSSVLPIHRRKYLASFGAVVSGVGLAGCLGGGNVHGEIVVEETVQTGDGTFRFDSSEGNTINVYGENRQGQSVFVVIGDPEGNRVAEEEIETEGTFSHTAEATGAYSVVVLHSSGLEGEAYIEVGIES